MLLVRWKFGPAVSYVSDLWSSTSFGHYKVLGKKREKKGKMCFEISSLYIFFEMTFFNHFCFFSFFFSLSLFILFIPFLLLFLSLVFSFFLCSVFVSILFPLFLFSCSCLYLLSFRCYSPSPICFLFLFFSSHSPFFSFLTAGPQLSKSFKKS